MKDKFSVSKVAWRRMKLYVLLIITFIVMVSIISGTLRINNSKKIQPVVQNGVIDLRNWDFKKDGKIKLNGAWEFYNNKLLSPTDFQNNFQGNREYLNLSGAFGEDNYGTFRIKVLLNQDVDYYAMKIDFIQNAYKVWANNSEIISVGAVGKSKEQMIPQFLPKTGSFSRENGEVYITLQVSNFYTSFGFIDTILLGESADVVNYAQRKVSLDLFLFGSTVMAAIYSLGVYFQRKKEKAPLYFSIVCVIVAIRTLILGERFFIALFPDFPYVVSCKIMILTFYLYIPFIALYIDKEYPKLLSKKLIKISNLSAIAYAVIIIASPLDYYFNVIPFFEGMAGIMLVHIIFKISRFYFLTGEGEYIAVLGVFALFITRINDILYEYSIIITGSFAALGTFMFILANYYVLARRQAFAFTKAEDANERLKSLDKMKDEFLAVTSHELKTPLGGIMGLSESLINATANKLNKDEIGDLNLINTSAKRLSNLVDDVLIFSTLKNKGISLDKKPVNLNTISELVIRICESYVKNKNIKIINLIDKEAPYILGDENRVEQIFYNLLGNAIKFTSNGKIIISYIVKGSFIEIHVKDSGIGIPKEKINKIFSLYEQVDGVAEKYGGTGLGLSVTKLLVELHGGTIYVISTVNKGSEFIFSLPICSEQKIKEYNLIQDNNNTEFKNKEVDNSIYIEDEVNNFKSSIQLSENIHLDNDKSKTYKVLVVDDEYVNQKIIENYLVIDNCTILKAFNGTEALTIIEDNEDLDLVILDMMMPDVLGYEVCKKIRENYSIFQLPILIMTADNRLESLVLSFESGANDYLKKPFDRHELISRVGTLLNLKKSVSNAIALAKQVSIVNKQVEGLNQEMKELEAYDKLKTEFFTNMSHELRTPLNVICTTIQLLGSLDESTNLGNEKIKYYIKIMRQNSLRLLRLINNIIDTSKIDGGYLNLNFTNGNIVYVVEEIVQSVAGYIKSKDIDIIFDTEVEEKIIAFDEEKIERIILNILSNAIKFTEKGGEIFINIFDKKDFIEISIKDTGIGIPENKLEFIFQRFAQVDKSTTRKNEGSGIGLSLVKSLVEMHGGTINANSKEGEGSDFIIKLPVRIIPNEEVEKNIVYKEVFGSKYEKNVTIEFSDIYM